MPTGTKIDWTPAMLRKLEKEYPDAPNTRILAEQIGVDYGSLKNKALALGLIRNRHSGSPWTKKLEKKLARIYSNTTNKEIADQLGVRESQVAAKAFKLGLQKSKEFMYMHSMKTAFRKGLVPANKGKKMTPEQYQKAKKTMFKKGHLPHNAVGFKNGHISLRQCKGGRTYKYIRLGKSKWYPLHQYIWEKKYGKPEPGHCLWFIDGDTMNCSIDNLELITRAENYRRNSAQNRLTDRYVAFLIVGKNDMHLIDEVLKDKKLIEAKRHQIILKRTIHDSTANPTETRKNEGPVLRVRKGNTRSRKLRGRQHQRKVRTDHKQEHL